MGEAATKRGYLEQLGLRPRKAVLEKGLLLEVAKRISSQTTNAVS
jgi:hypothetical protein